MEELITFIYAKNLLLHAFHYLEQIPILLPVYKKLKKSSFKFVIRKAVNPIIIKNNKNKARCMFHPLHPSFYLLLAA